MTYFGWLFVTALALAPHSALGQKQKKGDPGPPKPPVLNIAVRPGHVDFEGEGAVDTENPIATALRRAGPGTRITIQSGTYPAFSIGFGKPKDWNADTSGGNASTPVWVEGVGDVHITPGNSSDTIAFSQAVPNSNITFRNLKIECGYRAGIMFYGDGGKSTYEGFRFWDCEVLGGFDHLTDSGTKSKWCVWGSGLKDFEFRGVLGRAAVRDTAYEHGFYLQNSKGDILIENVDGTHLGRTFCQFTARPNEGPAGVGNIVVRNCKVVDCGISGRDNFKGGSAFTIAGRLTGSILFEKNSYRSGFDPKYRGLTRQGEPFGTGAFMAWDRGVGEPNGVVTLRDNDFESASGCGDRALVSLGGCREVRIEGKNRFVSGGKDAALDIDPLDDRGALDNSPIGKFVFANTNTVKGAIKRRGTETLFNDLVSPNAKAK